ncbi:MAG TPA: GAF domain-containing protein, partial [Burkholderiales bacterium]
MRRGAKTAKAKVETKLPAARKSRKSEGSRVHALEKRLGEALKREAEALEQQTATSDILRVISSSPTDVQPVFNAVVESAAHLCESFDAAVWRRDGDRLLLCAHHGPIPMGAIGEFFLPLAGSVAGRAVAEGRTIHIADIQADSDEYAASTAYSLRIGVRTILTVPLMREGVAIGAIAALRSVVQLYTPRQVALLETFADQAVIAIENVRLFNELEGRNREVTEAHARVTETLEQQTATSEILQVISQSPTEVQPVFETIVRNAVRLCGGVHGGVYRFDGQLVHAVAHNGFTTEELEEAWRKTWPRPVTAASVACQAIRTRSLVRIADIETAPELSDLDPEARANLRARGSRSVVAVPMRRQDDVIGAISLTHGEVDGFSDAHVELLKTFADQAVIAIENVRLFTELQEKNHALTEAHAQVTEALEQQTATSEILRAISRSQTDVQPVFDTIVRSAVRLCDGLFSALYQFDGELIHHVAQHNFTPEALEAAHRVYPARPMRALLTGRAILERALVHIPDVEIDPEHQYQALSRAIGVRSGLWVPMLREGAPIGVIAVTRAEPGPFS